MWFMLLALAAGLAIGLISGGRLAGLGAAAVRWPAVLALGAGIQVVSGFAPGTPGLVLLIASYAVLVAFTVVNIRFAGMVVVAIGIVMNSVVIAANGGMPVDGDAIVAAGIAARDEIDDLDFGTKRQLAAPGDAIAFLGDIVPMPLTREVLSFGDLVMAVGAADVMYHLVRRRARRVPGVVRDAAAIGSQT